MRVHASDGLRRLDERNGCGIFSGLSAVAGADAGAHDRPAVAGADVAAVAGADHAADVGAVAGAHDGAAHAEANAGSDAPARPSHGGAGLCSDAAAIGPADGGARGFDARVVLLLLLANNICANCSGNISSNEPRTLALLLLLASPTMLRRARIPRHRRGGLDDVLWGPLAVGGLHDERPMHGRPLRRRRGGAPLPRLLSRGDRRGELRYGRLGHLRGMRRL